MMKKIPILIEEWKPMWQVYPKSSHSFTKCADLSQKFALFAQSHIPCKLMQRFISTEEILLCLLYKTFSTMMENFENFYKLSPIYSDRSNGHGLSVRQWQDLVWHFYWPEKLIFSVKCVLIHDISHSEKSYNILPCQKFKLLTLTNSFKSNEYNKLFSAFLYSCYWFSDISCFLFVDFNDTFWDI